METKPVLSVRNLTTSFLVDGAWKSVVRDVSFDVAPGETVAIVGESGSGKSVTSLSLMRLLPEGGRVAEGRVRLAGEDLFALPEVAMGAVRGGRLAMIFQEPLTALDPLYRAGEQVAEEPRSAGDGTDARIDLLRFHHLAAGCPHALQEQVEFVGLVGSEPVVVDCRPQELAGAGLSRLEAPVQSAVAGRQQRIDPNIPKECSIRRAG